MTLKSGASLFLCLFVASCSDGSGGSTVGGADMNSGSPNGGVVANSTGPTAATSSQWTWAGGANFIYETSNYGSKGTSSGSNFPGGRYNSLSWVDGSGNFWLFGGFGIDNLGAGGLLNDMWEYSPTSGFWAWMSGSIVANQNGSYGYIGESSNVPGARRYSAKWADASGNLWLFGGQGYDSVTTVTLGVELNDLWKFNTATSQWTWVGGSSTGNQSGVYGTINVASDTNIPGARYGAASWVDSSGNFWLFGGYGYDSAANLSYLSDLWRLNPTSGQWTWMGGSSTGNQIGIYGAVTVASVSNIPGARYGAVSWVDGSGNFWLFGGQGYDIIGSAGYLNDLWQFNPTTSQWTWVVGAMFNNQSGIYGSMGVASGSNIPGSRLDSVAWMDGSGNLWLFGGYGFDSQSFSGNGNPLLNDLWQFNPTTSQWTWVGGSNIAGESAVYGSLGVASSSNIPGARTGAVSWLDQAGNFWLFGGAGYDTTTSSGDLCDLWNYAP